MSDDTEPSAEASKLAREFAIAFQVGEANSLDLARELDRFREAGVQEERKYWETVLLSIGGMFADFFKQKAEERRRDR